MSEQNLKVHSGDCCLCDVGMAVGATDCEGVNLHTGDIVMIWHGEHLGTDTEFWTEGDGLTVVVANQYQSYSDGSVKLLSATPEPFVMGIKGCGFNSPEWRIKRVKSFSDVVAGEHWPAFGFNYRVNENAALAAAEGK